MRLNKYTLKIENGQKTILYNVITKTLIELACSVEDAEKMLIYSSDDEMIDFYLDRLIISEDNNDDVEEMKAIKEEYNHQKDIGRYMIHLGYACNLKCAYCYQSSIHNTSKATAIDVDGICTYIYHTSQMQNFETYDICFIGGEPALYWREIIEISSRLNKMLGKDRIVYSMVTNGTLLDQEHHIEEIIANGVNDFQITVDGTKKTHDKYRNNGKNGSFERIMSNIKKLVENYSDIYLLINYNLTKENSNEVGNFLDLLNDEQIKIPVQFSMVFDNGINISLECHEHNSIWKQAHIEAIKHGQKYEPFYREVYLGCAMTQENYFIIGADGKLYKCINAVDNPNYCVSDMKDYGTKAYYETLQKYLSYEPDNKNCINCELYPVCYGGCEYRNRIHGFRCEKEIFYDNEIEIIKEIVNARSM
ncbi:MAG: radical SAM protein [Lachnospiraceae bacterium]|nr:radical SAM protein [Lachnospiraceae bacterium]